MFQLNKPALQTAGQILNQQCQASACAVLAAMNKGSKKPLPAPAVEDLIMAAVADLVRAGQGYRAKHVTSIPPTSPLLDDGLASAAINIFHLAAANDIDLGSVIAAQLAESQPF